ncbi:hypothetical protein Tco_0769169 [Tanacetum coccineum]|uniref:Reverse transcriptase Ty1/copia-type domain-containing protein n=1 Tax=Tanacetum coccineum TaxID=301880 RepID=A0ABQ4Z8Q7_9ASTR
MVVQTATNLTQDPSISSSSKDSHDVGFKPSEEEKRRMLIIQRIKILRLPIQYQELIKEQERKLEPKKVIQALPDLSWIKVMQEELLQFKLQHVWTLMDLPHGKRAIGTKWVYRNKKDERGIPTLCNRIVVYQMDVKSALLYNKIEEEVYACQPLGFEDPQFPDRGQSQDKYVDEILKKFGFSTVKTVSTPMDTSNPLLKDAEAKDVVVHLYRSMIGSLMYLTASRPDIMFVKQTIVANSTTEAEYVAASSCCGEMSSIGELTFFLGLQVTQKADGIFISQDKYVDKILKKLSFSTVKTGGAKDQIRFEAASKQSNDPPLSRVNTRRSGEDSMKLKELMEFYAKLSDRLEKKRRSRTYKPRRLYKVGLSRRIESTDDASLGAQEDASKQGRKIVDLDADIEVTLIDETQGRNDEDLMFDAGVLNSDEVFQEPIVNTDTTTKSSILVSVIDPVTTTGEVVTTASVEILEELSLAQTLIEIKSAKPKAITTTTIKLANSRPKAKGIIIHDQEEQASASTPIVSSLHLPQAKDKGKAKMVEPKKPLKKKDQIAINEEVARNLEV